MTKEQYVSMNRGINNGGDLDREVLESIYDDIAANEIKMKGGATKLLKSQFWFWNVGILEFFHLTL